jgi:hypothetical protein
MGAGKSVLLRDWVDASPAEEQLRNYARGVGRLELLRELGEVLAMHLHGKGALGRLAFMVGGT